VSRLVMGHTAGIAPVVGEPGLIAYECPNCVYVTSVLVQPNSGRRQFETPRVKSVPRPAK
jgi:hypothetical protein